MQLNKIQAERKAEQKELKKIYVLSRDIESGGSITEEDFKEATVSSTMIPSNAITMSDITMMIQGEEENATPKTIVAKINLTAGTILTSEMVRESDNVLTADIRKQEYNMIQLPTQIKTGEYIDIRLTLPSGEDYLVLSKKQVEIPVIAGVDSETTIWLNMSEADTVIMSNAIVEAYVMTGSRLYASTYVEPGMQEAIIPTYVPKNEIQQLIYRDPNIEDVAKNALITRYNANGPIRNSINSNLTIYNDNAQSNIDQKVQEQIRNAAQERKSYLESLSE